MMQPNQNERSFAFLRINEREGKPRRRRLTEIRGPYYSVVGRNSACENLTGVPDDRQPSK